MEISLGAEVWGTNGKLGQVKSFIIDPKSQRAEQMAISHTLGGERVVSLLRVTRVEGSRIYLDLDKQTFDTLEKFNPVAYRVPGRDRLDEPSWEQEGTTHFEPKVFGGVGQIPLDDAAIEQFDDPRSQAITPVDQREPVVSHDLAVLDNHDVKIGQVASFAVDQVTGKPVQLSVRQSGLSTHAREVPLDWIETITPLGIALKVEKGQAK